MSGRMSVSRRRFIGGIAAVAAVDLNATAESAAADERDEGGREVEDYSRVRGFNYQPSYGSHGLEVWGDAFDVDVFRREILQGKEHFPGINTIRLWLSYDAFVRYPAEAPGRFHAVIDLADELGVRFVPTLFNGWHSCPDFGGISVEMIGYWGAGERFAEFFNPYIDSLVKPHLDDERILLWDLCNEPFNSCRSDTSTNTILEWLKRVHAHCKECGATAPIGVGSVPNMGSVKMLEPISDVITFHPYYAWNAWVKTPDQYAAFVDEVVAFGKLVNKPLLVTETGWGALEDKKRSEVLAVELGTLSERNIGFVVHLLHHTLVADGHRPEYGPMSGAGYMAFVEKDGSLRPHHDIFNEY
ncbi:MAG: cellulase family glycosylhydrolase [bacterium]|nr:cellulase family glycosylhydrolase [bacterium]